MAGLLLKELKIRGLAQAHAHRRPGQPHLPVAARAEGQVPREVRGRSRRRCLRANYGQNPWQEQDQVITSVSWVSRIEDAKESLAAQVHWDLIIVDEAHKMSASSADKKTLAYQLGEALSRMTDHYLLMTATPHKGDPENFCLFLELLDRDVYGDVKSLEEAMRPHAGALLPAPHQGGAGLPSPTPRPARSKKLFTKRDVHTAAFEIDGDEFDFYDALTRYVEDQSIKAARRRLGRGPGVGFTMAMLQRRFASSIYAVRRSLERMRDKRQKILGRPRGLPPGADRTGTARRLRRPAPRKSSSEIARATLEDAVTLARPGRAPRGDPASSASSSTRPRRSRSARSSRSSSKLKDAAAPSKAFFNDPKMKLLVFTEHKDTLDYLAGDGKDGAAGASSGLSRRSTAA